MTVLYPLTREQLVANGKKGAAKAAVVVRRKHRLELMREIQAAYNAGTLRTVEELLHGFAQEILSEVE